MQLYTLFQQHPVICTDSRNCPAGSLFFALKGENFNANSFASKALENGCAYAIVDEAEYAVDDRYILVENVLDTLQQLAAFHRRQLGSTIIAITGTNGKTTTKELIAAVLKEKFNILFTQGNLNNHIGVPLTLLQLKPEHQIAIIEMGANHPGEITTLVEITRPDYGIITNVGKAHLEGFGSFEGVMKTKAELYNYIAGHRKSIFINRKNQYLNQMADKSGLINPKRIGYSISSSLSLSKNQGIITSHGPFLSLICKTENGMIIDLQTQLIGSYNAENVMAAVAIGTHFGLSDTQIKNGIENYQPKNNRSQFVETEHNKLIVDAYNANPTSMKAAIDNFAGMKVSNKVLILGDMLELGDQSNAEHQAIVSLMEEKISGKVILVGPEFGKTQNNYICFGNADMVNDFLKSNPVTESYVLIKGSRGIKLEKVLSSL